MSELREKINDVIENEPVALFMKGTPSFVMCGNSQRALQALREAGAPVAADIVEELADSGDLERKLEDALGAEYRASRDERVVDVLV